MLTDTHLSMLVVFEIIHTSQYVLATKENAIRSKNPTCNGIIEGDKKLATQYSAASIHWRCHARLENA